MRTALRLLIVLAAALAQASVLPYIRPLGVVPNLVLVVVMVAALNTTATRTLVMAIAGGLALDLAGGSAAGLATIGLVAVAGLTILAHRYGLAADAFVGLALLVIGATVLIDGIQLIDLALSGGQIAWWPAVSIIAREALLNVLLALLFAWIWDRLSGQQLRSGAAWKRLTS